MQPYQQGPPRPGYPQQQQQQQQPQQMRYGTPPQPGQQMQPRPMGQQPPRPMGQSPQQPMQPRPMGQSPMQPRPMGQQQPMQPRPMGQQQPMQPRPMGQQQPMQPRPMGSPQQPMQPRPMSKIPQQPMQPRPMGQSPQQPRPMGQSPQQPRPMGQSPQQPRPMGQSPQQPRPMGQSPQQPRPMGQSPQQPRPMGQSPQQPRPMGQSSQQPRQMSYNNFPPSQPPTQPPTQQMGGMSLGGNRPGTGLPPQQQPPRPGQPMQPPRGPQMNQTPPGGRPGTAPGPPMPQGAPPQFGTGPSPMGGQQFQNQQQNFAPPPNQMQQQPMDGGYPQNSVQQAQQLMDPNAQCDKVWMRTTFGNFPASDGLREQSGLRLGVVIQPLAEHPHGQEPPVIDFGATKVPRCRQCRGYINPFVQWLENGRRWRCNLCGRDNDTQSAYYSHLDANGQRVDKYERPELHKGCVEIIASEEYMIRPPQPPVFVFVVDVSMEAVQSGMLGCVVDAIRRNLDSLPGSPRTQVALITFDYAVHFYSLDNELSQPKMMVVSDLDDLFLPQPEDLLVNLADSRESFEMLLDSLPRIHGRADSQQVATGSAIQAAQRVMVHVGGKMMVFNTKLPSLGKVGKLKMRENPRALDTDKEKELLTPDNAFYTKEAENMSKSQISVELFLFPASYCDVATMQGMAKITAGQLHVYPRFSAQTKGAALVTDVGRSLLRENAWEAVFRLRASHGVQVKSFHGNFFLRGADLMQVANCDADVTYGLELKHGEGTVKTQYVSLQGALLYTKSNGQRRIRVSTSVFPVTTQLADVINSCDQEAICAFIAKNASQEVSLVGPAEVRNKLQNFCLNVLRGSRAVSGGAGGMPYGSMPPRPGMQNHQQQQQQQQGELAPSISMLPYYAMAMIKNPVFRGGNMVSLDERSAKAHMLGRLSLDSILLCIRPVLYEIHTMPPDCGRVVAVPADQQQTTELPQDMLPSADRSGRIKLPRSINLSQANLASNGIFLMNNGFSLMMWIGRGVDPRLTQSLFGVPSLDGIDAGVLKIDPGPGDDDFKQRVCNILAALRNQHPGGSYQSLVCFREGDQNQVQFTLGLVEDRAPFNGGSFTYQEFLAHCQRLASSSVNPRKS